MTKRTIAEFVGFQLVWLACAMGAAHQSNMPGILAAGAFVTLQLALQRSRALLVVTVATGLVGAAVESVLLGAGALRYAAAWPGSHLAPAWIVALWLAFGTTLATTARLLRPHVLPKAVLLGAACGPLAYAAGARLGALDITATKWLAYGSIAVTWALAFPVLLAFHERLSRADPHRNFDPA